MSENVVTIHARIEFNNPKALRALRVLAEALEDLEQDFGYRDDIKRAVKAGKYALRHITVTSKRA